MAGPSAVVPVSEKSCTKSDIHYVHVGWFHGFLNTSITVNFLQPIHFESLLNIAKCIKLYLKTQAQTSGKHEHLPEQGTILPRTTEQTIEYTAEEHDAVWSDTTTRFHP